jgi:hypothetical protein
MMKKYVLVMVVIFGAMVFLTGCGDKPSAVVEANIEALNKRDYGTIYDNFAATSPIREEFTRSEYLDVAENQLGISGDFRLVDFEVVEEEVRGDNAVVTWNAVAQGDEESNGPISDVTILVKEQGEWKVIE